LHYFVIPIPTHPVLFPFQIVLQHIDQTVQQGNAEVKKAISDLKNSM
jgi:hypothetical protein